MESTHPPTEPPLTSLKSCIPSVQRSARTTTNVAPFDLLRRSSGPVLLVVFACIFSLPNVGVSSPAKSDCKTTTAATQRAALWAIFEEELRRRPSLSLLQLASEGHRRGEGLALALSESESSEFELETLDKELASASAAPLVASAPGQGGDIFGLERSIVQPDEDTDELVEIFGSPNGTKTGNYPYQHSNTSPAATILLQSTKPSTINLAVFIIFGSVVLVTAFGCFSGHNSWVLAMILASYAVLIPGLFSKDFSFNIAMVMPKSVPIVGGMRFQVTNPYGHPGPVRESTRSLVPLLWDTGSTQGAILIFVFAFVVPVVKLALLLLARQWRESEEKRKVKWAIYSIWSVQVVSKWASPDMFAIALLYTLLRSVSIPPILESLAVLDLGFTCYNIFCAASVISTLAVRLPPDPYHRPEESAASVNSKAVLPQKLAAFGCLAGIVLWTLAFVAGANRSCLSMSLDTSIVLKALDLPTSLSGVASLLKLDDLVHAEISILGATKQYWYWFWDSHELNLLLAFTMLGGFGIALTVASISLLLVLTLLVVSGTSSPRKQWLLQELLRTCHVVRHVAMLDVVIVGLFVVSFAASIYKEQGIVIEIEHGIRYLIASEVLHNLLFWSVNHIGESSKEEIASAVSD